MAGSTHPTTPEYKAFLDAAINNHEFRKALLQMYNVPDGGQKWKDMAKQLVDNKVCTAGNEKRFLDEIVKIKWDEVNNMELVLGRHQDDDPGFHIG
jgi:hypothetical protein